MGRKTLTQSISENYFMRSNLWNRRKARQLKDERRSSSIKRTSVSQWECSQHSSDFTSSDLISTSQRATSSTWLRPVQ